MWQPPPIVGTNRWKEVYTKTEVARMFGVAGSTVLRVAKKKKCGFHVGHEWHFNLEHLERIYYGMSWNAQQRYNKQFKKP